MPGLLTGMMATLAGIGLARLAYTPLLPALIQEGWFSAGQAAYLGAANLLGYLIGALVGHPLSERIPARAAIGLSFVAISLSFLFCAVPGSFGWFFVWRLMSGIAGAVLMVVGPSLALSALFPSRRTGVGALAFTGIGLGVLLSATVVPVLLEASLVATWLALGGLSVMVGIVCDRSLVRLRSISTARHGAHTSKQRPAGEILVALLVTAAYALDAVGYVPHTVFWVDYLIREQGMGARGASLQWAIFGVGAFCGPFVAGCAARRLGWHTGLSLAFLAKAAAVALPLLSVALISRSVSSFTVGAMIPAIVALTSGRLAELVDPAEHKRLWGRATAVFAAAQAAAGYGMSALYDAWGSYTPLFAIGGFMLAGGLLLVLLSQSVHAHGAHMSPLPRRQ